MRSCKHLMFDALTWEINLLTTEKSCRLINCGSTDCYGVLIWEGVLLLLLHSFEYSALSTVIINKTLRLDTQTGGRPKVWIHDSTLSANRRDVSCPADRREASPSLNASSGVFQQRLRFKLQSWIIRTVLWAKWQGRRGRERRAPRLKQQRKHRI